MAQRPWAYRGCSMAACKIPVAELQPGMYVVDTGLPWTKAPLLYAEEGPIASRQEVERIVAQGYSEAFHDPERFSPPMPQKGAPPLETATQVPDEAPPAPETWGRRVSFEEELTQARKIYASSFDYVKGFMRSPYAPLDVATSEPYVEAIIGSLDRNADALISLSKLCATDAYTFTHSVNVTIFAVAYARFLGLDGALLQAVGVGGLFHDLGKALIPQEILNAPRRLDFREMQIMQTHVLRGYEKISQLDGIAQESLQGVLQHHEKHNGTGYPYGLAGKRITPYGRILSLSDVYDALTSFRVYKKAVPAHQALGIMYTMRNKSWAPGAVERFIKLMGVFPVGSPVELNDGRRGVVCRANASFPTRPQVVLVQDIQGRRLPPETVDLAKSRGLEVLRTLAPEESAAFDIQGLLRQARPG